MKICRHLLIVWIISLFFLHAASAGPVKLVVWGIQLTGETKDLEAEIAEFQRMHPEIQVVTLSMGAGGMNPQKLMTAIVGGVPPDVIEQDRFTIGDWASRGAFQPLDKYIAADKNSTNPLAIREENFLPSPWAETKYQGHIYAIPLTTDDRVLYYNRSAFSDAGLNPNNPPQTWDELIYDAKKITKKNKDGTFKRLGFDPLYSQGWLYGHGRKTASSCPPMGDSVRSTIREIKQPFPQSHRGTTSLEELMQSVNIPAASAAPVRRKNLL
jgi:multiple sugar transport system permease protein